MTRRLAASLMLALTVAGCVDGKRERPRGGRPTALGPGYVVRPGDTLLAIAGRLGVDMAALARANGLGPPYLIRVGQRLVVPPRPPASAAARPIVPPPPRPAPAPTPVPPPPRPSISPPTVSVIGAPRLAWPGDGPVSERFSPASGGIAIGAHPGSAARAAAAGTVTFASDEPQGGGKLVRVDHGGGWVSVYRHLARVVVAYGERIGSGARVGFVGGSVGRTSALRFELRRDDAAVDPLPLLPPRF
ncbi:MAG: peptidoglycan DD-metalloendopeptidase family protein [Novosphingobium sp.]